MTNQYQRGRRVEQAVIDDLGARGYDCVRSAGSKGAADVVAVHDAEILFVQVKVGASALPSPAEREQLLRIAHRLRTPGGRLLGPVHSYAVVAYKRPDPDDGRRVQLAYRQLLGPGPKEFAPFTPQPVQEITP